MSEHIYILELDGMQQSAVDLDDPTNLVFDYMRRIGDLIDAAPPGPLRVLHIGGAAMSLPRYVAATRPGSAQIVLEPNEIVIAQVRALAPVPRRAGIKVRAIDGATGIQQIRDASADLVILDAFDDARVPGDLTTVGFIEQVRRVLAPGAMFVANLVDQPPWPLVRAFVGVGRVLGQVVVGAEPATVKGRRPGNVLTVFGVVPRQAFGAPSPMEYRVFSGAAVRDRFGA